MQGKQGRDDDPGPRIRLAVEALRLLAEIKDRIEVVTYPAEMGEDEARESGFEPTVVGSITSGETTSDDTQQAARDMEEMGVDLLLFAGGNGTARDVHSAVDQRVTALGIPAGVKIHSAVFAATPHNAGTVARMFLEERVAGIRDGEVMDIDEDAFRDGVVAARLHGYLRVPEERRHVQRVKSGGEQVEEDVQGIAAEVSAGLEDGRLYVMGPGTTIGAIMEHLGLENTLLGVDVVRDRALVAGDVSEGELLELIGDAEATIVVTIIGGQGYILGRGNQQLSPAVVRKVGRDNITVVATREKLASLDGGPLLVDTGDWALDDSLGGYWRVVTGHKEFAMYRAGE